MKVLGTANPADLMTKYLTREKVDTAIDKMGQVVLEGRANSTLDIQGKTSLVQEILKMKKWTRDSQRQATGVGGARASAAESDRWERYGEQVVRIHSQPRSALFAATAKDGTFENLGPVRTTRMMDSEGNEFVLHDYWRASRRPQRHQPFRWARTTTFHHGGKGPEEADA